MQFCIALQLGAVSVVGPDQILEQDTVYVGSPVISLGKVQRERAIRDMHGTQVKRSERARPREQKRAHTRSSIWLTQMLDLVMMFIYQPMASIVLRAPVLIGIRHAYNATSSVGITLLSAVVLFIVWFIVATLAHLLIKWTTAWKYADREPSEHWDLQLWVMIRLQQFGGGALRALLEWLQGTEWQNMVRY